MDKNLLSKGGSSDPRCVLSLVDGDGAVVGKPIKSAHQSKTLEPKWREVHEFDVEDGSLVFKCVVEDYDAVSSADFMGDVTVALSELPPQKVVRKWYSLGDDKGEVELVLQWCYDADRDFEAFPEVDESGKMPNELCVGVFRARNLAVKDKGIVGKGSSDPYVKLKVAGTTLERRTKVKKTTLDPVLERCINHIVVSRPHAIDATPAHWWRSGLSRAPDSLVNLRTGMEGTVHPAALVRAAAGQTDAGARGVLLGPRHGERRRRHGNGHPKSREVDITAKTDGREGLAASGGRGRVGRRLCGRLLEVRRGQSF